jgi:predicted RNA-binding protein with PIN domain
MRALIVDGYNIIHAWPALSLTMRTRGLEDARRELVARLAEYAAQTGVAVTVVFDGQARRGGAPGNEHHDGVTVLFGSKHASADHVIERAAYQAVQRGEGAEVVVATDDRLERDVVGGMGVATMGARALQAEVTPRPDACATKAAGARGSRTASIRRCAGGWSGSAVVKTASSGLQCRGRRPLG